MSYINDRRRNDFYGAIKLLFRNINSKILGDWNFFGGFWNSNIKFIYELKQR